MEGETRRTSGLTGVESLCPPPSNFAFGVCALHARAIHHRTTTTSIVRALAWKRHHQRGDSLQGNSVLLYYTLSYIICVCPAQTLLYTTATAVLLYPLVVAYTAHYSSVTRLWPPLGDRAEKFYVSMNFIIDT